MKNYIVYDNSGTILRTGCCSKGDFFLQVGDGEFVMEGIANDVTQKIVDGKVVDKTPEEIEADNPTPIPVPFEKQPANITNEQWQNILNRISELETKA